MDDEVTFISNQITNMLDPQISNVDERVALLQQQMRKLGVSVLTPYPRQEDFIIGYVKNRVYANEKIVRTYSYGLRYSVVLEQIGHIFNHHNVAVYLSRMFPDRNFTLKDVDLCYHIMKTVIEKSTFVEQQEEDEVDFCHDDDFTMDGEMSYLVSSTSLQRKLHYLFNIQKINLVCDGLRYQGKEDNFPRYQLIELMDDVKKRRVFFDYWRTVPDYTSIYCILTKGLNMPADIANLIICMVSKNY